MQTPFGKRVVVSALLSGLLNALLIAASIGSAHEETDTFIQDLIRIVGLPAGIMVRAVGAEGHGAAQAALLTVYSFAFYWILIFAAWAAVQHGRRPAESQRKLPQ